MNAIRFEKFAKKIIAERKFYLFWHPFTNNQNGKFLRSLYELTRQFFQSFLPAKSQWSAQEKHKQVNLIYLSVVMPSCVRAKRFDDIVDDPFLKIKHHNL